MDQDHREYLEDRGSHQLEVEAYERERVERSHFGDIDRSVVQGDGWEVIHEDGLWFLEIGTGSHVFTENKIVALANAILSEVEIAQRGEDVLHPAYGDCEVCHGARTVAVAGPDENGQYDTDDCPACTVPIKEES